MKSNISLFNLGIIKQDFKQHGWLSIIYLLGLLFSLPLQMIMIDSDPPTNIAERIETFFDIGLEVLIIFLYTVPILAGIFLFRYLQTKDSSVMVHSLPIKRGSLYINHVISGMLMLIIPVLITSVVTWAVRGTISFGENFTFGELLLWTGIVTLLTVFLFACSVFVGMLSGISVAQGIITYIVLMLPMGLLILIAELLNNMLYGFSTRFLVEDTAIKWSPLVQFVELYDKNNPYSHTEIIIYIILTVILFIAGWLLYKVRPLEAVGQVLTFKALKPIFKYGVTFCTMLLSAVYFSQQDISTAWVVFGYIAGTIIGYLVAVMVLEKSWRVFKARMLIDIVGYGLVIAVVVVAIKVDVFGYETKIPETAEVKNVYYGSNVYRFKEKLEEGENPFHSDEQYINDILSLHHKIVNEKTEFNEEEFGYRDLERSTIVYELEDGSMVAREYVTPLTVVATELKPIYESEIYKRNDFNFDLLDKNIGLLRLSGRHVDKELNIYDLEKINEFKKLLRQDILSLKYEDMIASRPEWGDFEITVIDDGNVDYDYSRHYDWDKRYKGIENWMKDNGYLEQVRVMANDIVKLEIAQINQTEEEFYDSDKKFDEITDKDKVIKITETTQMEQLLNHSHYGYGKYVILVTLKSGRSFTEQLDETHVPDSIKKALE
ncbi:hypothetical protein [Bacillus solimangrovi]|uniref:Multidrug ABC transporter permease n=1 Tax=Bacillus solimangrovi TaxID=1305675 RepID=A0A1E5LJH1_9BACI|nr:hypothetical protein [Bacillus solimangrovi]OEH94168.1 hypothetical protein BFG57_08945 [Bacillus solimangrovi]